jgi:hypothetical protein
MQHIQNGRRNSDVIRFQYRKLFHLSAAQMNQEPVDEMALNLYIYSELNKQEERASRHGTS